MIKDWKANPAAKKIGLASDHGGFDKKNRIAGLVAELGYEAIDFGPKTLDPKDDYPDFAAPLCTALRDGKVDAGILLCRSGIGMSIIANRFHGLRAALAEDVRKARSSREHNCSNILVTGGDAMGDDELADVVKTWLDTPFSNEERLLSLSMSALSSGAASRSAAISSRSKTTPLTKSRRFARPTQS